MFYVYTLIDPRDGEVFYVGKGTGGRINHHEAEARKGMHGRKCARIRAIWNDGAKVGKSVVSRHFDENEAYASEAALIDVYGLANLTNILPGGVIGQNAYLARMEQRARYKAIHGAAIYRKAFDGMAPKLARMLNLIETTGGFGMMIRGAWFDMTDAALKIFRDVVKILGHDYVAERMRMHGANTVPQ